MLHDILSAELVGPYCLRLYFDDGRSGVVDFSSYLERGGVFERWKVPAEFLAFRVDPELKNLVWPGDLDLAPETLYAAATGQPLPSWCEPADRLPLG